MKTLYIMRHGQKNMTSSNQEDYDIELTQKGLNDCKLMAKKLKEKEVLLDLIVASPSKRTRQTAEIISEELNYKKNIMYNEVIYQAFLNEIIESITYTFDNVNTLMVIGHNPALTALGFTLGNFKRKLGMGEVLKIDFNCNSWTLIDKSNASIAEHITL